MNARRIKAYLIALHALFGKQTKAKHKPNQYRRNGFNHHGFNSNHKNKFCIQIK